MAARKRTKEEIEQMAHEAPYYRERKKHEPKTDNADNIQASTQMFLDNIKSTIKRGRPAIYEDSPKGLALFKRKTCEYLENVQEINDTLQHKIIPDIEGWACYMGVTTYTLREYQKNRSDEWRLFIEQFRNGIASIKKQGAFSNQINSVIAMFDLCNTAGYVNTSEFKLKVETKPVAQKALTDAEIGAMLGLPCETEVVSDDGIIVNTKREKVSG